MNLALNRFRKLLTYYKPYYRILITDLVCALIVSVISLIIPLGLRQIIKLLESQSSDVLTQIYTIGAGLLILIATHTVCNMYIAYKGHMMGAMMESDMRSELFDHYQKLSFRFYDNQKTGQLMSRMTNDVFSMTELFHHGPEDIIISLIKFVGGFVILININVELTLIVFLFLPIMAAFSFYTNRRMNRALRKSQDRIGDINERLEDSLGGIRVIKSFTNEQVEKEKFAHENNRFLESRREGYMSETIFYEGMVAFNHLLTVAVIIFGAISIVRASLDLADLLTFFMCIAILIEPIQHLINFARLYHEGITGFDRFMEILETKPDIQDADQAVELTNVKGRIQFDDVSFYYKKENGYVLNNINLDIQAGEYVALVGPSGAGKTTLCSLIPRFYDVVEGRIRIDGVDIKDIKMRSLREQIGIVQQDVYLFAGTVADNIRYGRLDASMEEIIEAAKLANAHEFIMSLPNGYDTDIGQRGVKLSGGQKQRLSIARAFLKNPPILIFDEATSALDHESEQAIQQSMEKLIRNRTTIVIAHRLSTIRNAQRIIVLAEKSIAEEGKHEELLKLNGTYARLYHMQAKI